MNDDRKFERLAHRTKVLLEHNIPYKVVAETLGVSLMTVANYKIKVEKQFGILLPTTRAKTGQYAQMLKIYAAAVNEGHQSFRTEADYEELQVLKQAADKIIGGEQLKSAISGAASLYKFLCGPEIASPNVNFVLYLKIIEDILNVHLLEPLAAPRLKYLENQLWSQCLKAIREEKVELSRVTSPEQAVEVLIGQVVLKNLDRSLISTLRVEEKAVVACLDKLLLELSGRENYVLRSYYGLQGEKILTLDEIAEKFDLSRERIRTIKDKAIRRLGSFRRSLQLAAFFHDRQKDKLKDALHEKLIDKNIQLQLRLQDLAGHDLPFTRQEIGNLRLKLDYRLLSIHARNVLALANIETMYELVAVESNELMRYRSLGRKTLEELTNLISYYGFRFGMISPEMLEKIKNLGRTEQDEK